MKVVALFLSLLVGGFVVAPGPRELRSQQRPRQASDGMVWTADGAVPPPPPVAPLARA